MKYGFTIYKTKVEEHVFWIAESKDLKGCVGQGDTIEEAIDELKSNEESWLETAKEVGLRIPEPSIELENEYSGKFVTRVSPTVHRDASENARKQGISLNQYVNNAIITMNAAQSAAEYVKAAAKEAVTDIRAMAVSSTEYCQLSMEQNK